MKRINRLISVLFLALLVLSACEEEEEQVDVNMPKACFEYAPSNVIAGAQIQFTSCSTNGTSYAWDFGNGTTSSEENPTHTFSKGGDHSVSLTVTNEHGDDKITKTITVSAPTIISHSENIEKDETWSNTAIHIIERNVHVKGAILTIEPGTIIKFESGTKLTVGYYNEGDATLIANGTVDAPIVFTSNSSDPKAGDWEYISFDEYSTSNCSMQYCTIEFAGGYNGIGAVSLDKAEITFDNNTIQHSASLGVSLDENSKFKSFTNNTIKETAQAPIELDANYVHTIGTGNSITSSIGIWIDGGSITQTEALWHKQTVPYVIDGTIYLGNSTGSKLTIEAGTTIAFSENSSFRSSYYSDQYATFIAEGTAEEPITFTSNSVTPKAGDWYFMDFENGTSQESVLDHCIIEYGGGYSDDYGIVTLSECAITIKNTTIRNSAKHAVTMDETASFVTFENNTISNIPSYAMKINPNAVHSLKTGNNFTDDNGILVEDGTFTLKETWLPQNTRYVLEHVKVGKESTGAELTIAPGTTIAILKNEGISVGYYSDEPGKLVAQGTDEKPIIFTSAFPEGSKAAGQWNGIFFHSSTSAGSIIDKCILEYGGGYSGDSGIIYCDDVTDGIPTITNNTIRYSASHGIEVYSCSPTISDNSFSNIEKQDIHFD